MPTTVLHRPSASRCRTPSSAFQSSPVRRQEAGRGNQVGDLAAEHLGLAVAPPGGGAGPRGRGRRVDRDDRAVAADQGQRLVPVVRRGISIGSSGPARSKGGTNEAGFQDRRGIARCRRRKDRPGRAGPPTNSRSARSTRRRADRSACGSSAGPRPGGSGRPTGWRRASPSAGPAPRSAAPTGPKDRRRPSRGAPSGIGSSTHGPSPTGRASRRSDRSR